MDKQRFYQDKKLRAWGQQLDGGEEYLWSWWSSEGALGAALTILGLEVPRGVGPVVAWRQGELWWDKENWKQLVWGQTVFTSGGQDLEEIFCRFHLEKSKAWQCWRWPASQKVLLMRRHFSADPPEAVTLVERQVRLIGEMGAGLTALELALARRVWPAVLVARLLESLMYTWISDSLPDRERPRLEKYIAEVTSGDDWRVADVPLEAWSVKSKARRQLAAAVELVWWRQEAERRLAEYLAALHLCQVGAETEAPPAATA